MNIIVTGGAGYIGSHTCKALAKNNYIPITYDNLSTGHQHAVKWGPFERGDINDQERLQQVITALQPHPIHSTVVFNIQKFHFHLYPVSSNVRSMILPQGSIVITFH